MISMIVTMGGVWDWKHKPKDGDVCPLAEIFKKEDDEESEEEEQQQEDDNEIEAADELMKKFNKSFFKIIKILLLDFL